MSRPADFDVQKIIDYLQGTCNDLDASLRDFYPEMEYEDLTDEDLQQIDNQIFLCDQCGWWCEISEQADEEEEGYCAECRESMEKDED